MNSLAALSLLAVASALTTNEVGLNHQSPLLPAACPSDSTLSSGECRPTYNPQAVLVTPNASQPIYKSRHNPQHVAELPWSFWPECYASENTTEPVCVFSHQGFASGRGIFIVSTATRAHKMLRKPAFADPAALRRINTHENPPYELREFPGKGRGLVANKTLHKGDQIFASTPLLLSDPYAYKLVEAERLALSKRGVEQLPERSQALFWELLDHFKGDPIDDRINTNAFEIEVDGTTQYAVLPEIAMLNHDCRPNAAYFWDEETLSHHVHAIQTIRPGEEITITYINNEQKRKTRMDLLQASWGFQCSCSSCSAHPAFTKESDARIKQIGELASNLDNWTSDSEATPEMAEALISLYKQERLVGSLGGAYKQAAEAYASFGDKWNAVRYARLSAEYSMLDSGFRNGATKDMVELAKEPEMAWSWKKRVGLRRHECGCRHAR